MEMNLTGLLDVLQTDSSKSEIANALFAQIWVALALVFVVIFVCYLLFGLAAVKKGRENFVALMIIVALLEVILFFAFPFLLTLLL